MSELVFGHPSEFFPDVVHIFGFLLFVPTSIFRYINSPPFSTLYPTFETRMLNFFWFPILPFCFFFCWDTL